MNRNKLNSQRTKYFYLGKKQLNWFNNYISNCPKRTTAGAAAHPEHDCHLSKVSWATDAQLASSQARNTRSPASAVPGPLLWERGSAKVTPLPLVIQNQFSTLCSH